MPLGSCDDAEADDAAPVERHRRRASRRRLAAGDIGVLFGAGAQGSLTAQVRLGGVRIFRFPMVIRVRVVHAADLREWYIENGFR